MNWQTARRIHRHLGVLGLLVAILACGDRGQEALSYARRPAGQVASGPTSIAPSSAESDRLLGDGFVVWESNRSGAWRLWTVPLAGGEPRQLTADEEGRSHCCPHIAPDGSRIAYLSVVARAREYPQPTESGVLRLLDADGSAEQVLVGAARTYFENRAVVWRSPSELIFIDEGGVTRLLDLESGRSTPLTATGAESYGWLLDPRLEHATSGSTLFSRYQTASRSVLPGAGRTGCQPYFTHDGRWGFWMAAPGGPLDVLELASGRRSTVVRKSDARLPPGLGYVYFPMISARSEALVFAASADEHDHFRADYEIFVAPLDPETLELEADPRRLTHDPATDRYPDVWVEPLPLGRWRGEAPFTLRLAPPADAAGPVTWSFGDGTDSRAGPGEHTFTGPGRYRLEATAGDQVFPGLVLVAPPAPPAIVSTALEDLGSTVVVRFDEPIALARPAFSLDSGIGVRSWSLTADGRGVALALAEPIGRPDRLALEGIDDRAQRPNRMAQTVVDLEPPRWPSDRRGLVFLWETAAAPNLVFDAGLEVERACVLEPSGRARLDHDFAMRLAGGMFTASEEQSNALRWAFQATNELTLELRARPGDDPSAAGRLVSFSSGARGQNFYVEERAGRLFFGLRVESRGPGAVQEAEIAHLEPGRRSHVAITYSPGALRTYVDGELAAASEQLDNGFFHWKTYRLAFGDDAGGGHDWPGELEGIALFDRVLEADEIRENFRRYEALIAERPRVPQLVVEARLLAATPTPSLADIAPYREALAVSEYEVSAAISGGLPGQRLRVAEWVLLDGRPLERPAVGAARRLVLEPYALNRQLESVFLADTLAGQETTLYYATAD